MCLPLSLEGDAFPGLVVLNRALPTPLNKRIKGQTKGYNTITTQRDKERRTKHYIFTLELELLYPVAALYILVTVTQ